MRYIDQYKKNAIIEFHSQKDYHRFHLYFNQCLFMDRYIDVAPISDTKAQGLKKEMYVRFSWYVWKSHRKAMVEYME